MVRFRHTAILEACHFQNLGERFPLHFHDNCVFGTLLAGSRIWYSPSCTVTVHPFELCALNPFEPHGCRAVDKEPGEWISIHVNYSSLAAATAPGACPDAYPLINSNICKRRETGDRFARLAFSFLYEQAEAMIILDKLVGLLKSSGLVWPNIGQADEIYAANARYCKVMPSIIKDGLPAFQQGAAKYKYLRWFKAKYGITPGACAENLRVNKGRNLVEKGFTIAEAAQWAGFWDQSHFTRRFKTFYGFTPGIFKKAVTRNG